jgi:hypothetical protein
MTANPSSDLHTGQVIDIQLTITNNGPQPADVLNLSSSWFYHEFSVTHIDSIACYQFGGAMGDGVHPIFILEWFVAGLPDIGLQPFAVGETRTCHFQLTLMADAPAVTPFTFAVSGYDPDIDPINSTATVYLARAIPVVPSNDALGTGLLVMMLGAIGSAASRRQG